VRLTAAGTRLAATVLRRHRLVELFLVQVMGMCWDEVHDDAEHLEHVVSDRLIDRIDEMLGHRNRSARRSDPRQGRHDPRAPLRDAAHLSGRHAGGRRAGERSDPVFLRFVERHGLKPGQVVSVDARDEVADAVQLRGADDTTFTLGARAASKLLVDVTPEAAAAATPSAGRNAAPRR
jgi:DtxR family Mn-dependent transcriptional regulator